MAERTIITLVCDVHGEESNCQDVRSHTLTVDRRTRDFEACEKEWAKVEKVAAVFLEKGRTRKAGNGKGAKS